jgi:hypothetical protein
MHRVRAVALVVLVAGIGLALWMGTCAVAVGLSLIGALCFGLLVPSLNKRLKSHPEQASPVTGTGTAIMIFTTEHLPTLVVGILCVAVTPKYRWMGFLAGWFRGSSSHLWRSTEQ